MNKIENEPPKEFSFNIVVLFDTKYFISQYFAIGREYSMEKEQLTPRDNKLIFRVNIWFEF